MNWSARLFNGTAWLTARHIAHFQAQQFWLARIGQWLMRFFDLPRYNHAAAVTEQQYELHELQALRAAFQMKRAADLGNGWKGRHMQQFDAIAYVLINQHDWEIERVGELVESLTDGHFVLTGGGDDDDDDDDD